VVSHNREAFAVEPTKSDAPEVSRCESVEFGNARARTAVEAVHGMPRVCARPARFARLLCGFRAFAGTRRWHRTCLYTDQNTNRCDQAG